MVKSKYVCGIRGHDDEYTEEYENADGHVQADAVCQRCGRRRVAWTGPTAERIRSLGYNVPQEAVV